MAEPTASGKMIVFGLHMKDLESLYKAYMPFFNSGGIFIPTTKPFALEQLVGLRLKLLEEPTEYKVKGKVSWITPESAQGRWLPGIGVQFTGDDGSTLNHKIQELLGDNIKSDKPTNTI